MLEEVELLLHKKPEAPLAVNVTESPAQIEEADALIFTLGAVFTTIVVHAEPEHPLALIPVTK
jgi:hypothetical protein